MVKYWILILSSIIVLITFKLDSNSIILKIISYLWCIMVISYYLFLFTVVL